MLLHLVALAQSLLVACGCYERCSACATNTLVCWLQDHLLFPDADEPIGLIRCAGNARAAGGRGGGVRHHISVACSNCIDDTVHTVMPKACSSYPSWRCQEYRSVLPRKRCVSDQWCCLCVWSHCRTSREFTAECPPVATAKPSLPAYVKAKNTPQRGEAAHTTAAPPPVITAPQAPPKTNNYASKVKDSVVAATRPDLAAHYVSSAAANSYQQLSSSLSAVLTSLAPSWPAESAALSGLSQLPNGLRSRVFEAGGAGHDRESSAVLARQLVRGAYALAGIVVAVMAWQLAAAVSGVWRSEDCGSCCKYGDIAAMPNSLLDSCMVQAPVLHAFVVTSGNQLHVQARLVTRPGQAMLQGSTCGYLFCISIAENCLPLLDLQLALCVCCQC